MFKKITNPLFIPLCGWFILSVASLFQFLLQTSPSVMIPDLEKSFGLDPFGVSLIASSFFYTYLLCQIPAGILIDQIRPRRTMSVCLFMLGVLCLSFAKASHVNSLVESRILMGIFAAPSFVAAFYFAARYLPDKYFPLLGGLTETLGMLGGVAGESLLARGIELFNWRNTMLILSGIAFLLALCVWKGVRDPKIAEPQPSENIPPQSILRGLYCILLLPQAWINGIFCGLMFGIISGFAAFWSVPFLMMLYHIPLRTAADMSSIMFVGTALGTPVIGWLTARIRNRRLLMFCGAAISLMLSIIVVYLSPASLKLMVFYLFWLGFFAGVYLIPFAVIRDITPPQRRGTAMGYINMMCILTGAPLLQPLIGWLLHFHATITLKAYHHALVIMPFSLIVAMFLTWFVVDAKKIK